MKTRSNIYYDPGNHKQLNNYKVEGEINLNQGVGIAFFLDRIRAPPNNLSLKVN